MAYRRRVLDSLLDEVFPYLPAVALEGAKGVGKTATATQRAATVMSLALRSQRELLAADMDRIAVSPPPVLIDEWQLEPDVWDRVKIAVDEDRRGGRFILAGSAGVPPGSRIHSGAGRIVSFHMRPLALAERGLSEQTVSLRAMLGGEAESISGMSPVALSDYVDEILRSGFPGFRETPQRALNLELDSYLQRIVDRELPDNGVTIRRPNTMMAWLRGYAAATSTDAAYSVILDAATAGESDKPSRVTVGAYRDHLERIFVLDPIPAWIPAFNPIKRLTKTPKHHLVDPALAARLVGVGREGLLKGDGTRVARGTGTWLGALFESLAAQSVRVYAQAADATTGHLRLGNSEREIDLIVEGEDRRVVAIEVKLVPTVSDHDVRHLLWLRRELGERAADLVVLTTGREAYRRRDGVAVVPLALLGP